MTKTVNKRRAETLNQTLSSKAGHYPTGGFWISKLKVGPYLGHVGHCPVGPDIVRRSLENVIFSQNPSISF
jgi:hypothetical protein